MLYSKAIIDLIKEVRRRVPAEDKPSIKLANPNLFYELIPYYHETKDAVLRALIKEVFQLAGEDWKEKLKMSSLEDNNKSLKVYRGQVSLVDRLIDPSTKPKPKRMYRGQVVFD